MNLISNFLIDYGLSEKQKEVYLACLSLGASGVTEISRKAGTKRPCTYLVLNELIKLDMIDLIQEKDKTKYFAKNPKKIFQKLKELYDENENILPLLMNMYDDRSLKPKVNIYDDYKTYERLADNVREYVSTGKEASYFGNSEFFHKNQAKVNLWFKTMKNKGAKCREIIVGDSDLQKKFPKIVADLQNPNYKVKRLINPVYKIDTEFGIWGNNLYLFSGSGKELYTIVVENSQIVNMHKVIFEVIWNSLPDQE